MPPISAPTWLAASKYEAPGVASSPAAEPLLSNAGEISPEALFSPRPLEPFSPLLPRWSSLF